MISQLLFWLALSVFMVAALQLPIVRAEASPLEASYPLAAALGGAGLLFPAMRAPIPNPLVADIVDHDEALPGQRREAIYFGVQGLLVKAGMGVGGGLAAVLLGVFGAELARQGGFIVCPLVAMGLALLAAAVFRHYPGD